MHGLVLVILWLILEWFEWGPALLFLLNSSDQAFSIIPIIKHTPTDPSNIANIYPKNIYLTHCTGIMRETTYMYCTITELSDNPIIKWMYVATMCTIIHYNVKLKEKYCWTSTELFQKINHKINDNQHQPILLFGVWVAQPTLASSSHYVFCTFALLQECMGVISRYLHTTTVYSIPLAHFTPSFAIFMLIPCHVLISGES